jgi:hypothetical protein
VHIFLRILLEKERRKGLGKRHFKLANERFEINHDMALRGAAAIARINEQSRRNQPALSKQVIAKAPERTRRGS